MQLITEVGRSTPRPVPLIGLAQAGAGGYFDDGGFPVGKGWDEIRVSRPSTTSMPMRWRFPATRWSPPIATAPSSWCRRRASVRRGDRVVVKTRDGEVMVKELKRKHVKTIELRSINPEHGERTLPVRDVVWIARIVWASQ